MQTLIKKWDDLSINEVQSIFCLRSEVFIVEQECPFQDVDGRDPEADHLLLYENNREQKQWTLDRLDNSCGHTKDNVVISCLKCNLERRCLNDEKFLFTKQMRLIKKH